MSFLKTLIRFFSRYKNYTAINSAGLILGFTCSVAILLYVGFESSFDNFHTDKDKIFRVINVAISPDNKEIIPAIRIPVAPDMKAEYAEIESYNRLRLNRQSKLLEYNQHKITIEKTLYADDNFFDFFSFSLLKGNPLNVLTDDNSVVLTEGIVEKLFGDLDPVGSSVLINNKSFIVTGIAADPPRNSHIQFDAVFPVKPLIESEGKYLAWDGGMSANTFIKLHQADQVNQLQEKLPQLVWEKLNKKNEGSGFFDELLLEPLDRIHLHSDVDWDNFKRKDSKNIFILLAVGLLILVIAVINYILISKGIFSLRLKEFSVKKLLGIGKLGIFNQIVIESSVTLFVTAIVSVLLILIFKDRLEHLFGNEFIIFQLKRNIPFLIILVFGLVIITSLVHLAGNRIILTRTDQHGLNGTAYRNKKVAYISAIQFSISITLIFSMLVIYKQLDFALHKDLGFRTKNIVFLSNDAIGSKHDLLVSEICKIPGVESATTSFGLPGLETTANGYQPEGTEQWYMYNAMHVDDNFFDTYGIELLDGRNFRKGNSEDKDVFIINETLAKKLNWADPVGKYLFRNGNHQIIGVVKDFHVSSISEEIPPLIISKQWQDYFYSISIALNTSNTQQTIDQIEKVWNSIMPNAAFNYSFLDVKYQSLYDELKTTGRILVLFTILSVLVSMLGIFGISFLLLGTRVKEIGVRKVNGAKSMEILYMLNKEVLLWIIISCCLGLPLGWYFMQRWLTNYAYTIDMSLWMYILSGLAAAVIAVMTISWQSWKTASRNPVKALRYE